MDPALLAYQVTLFTSTWPLGLSNKARHRLQALAAPLRIPIFHEGTPPQRTRSGCTVCSLPAVLAEVMGRVSSNQQRTAIKSPCQSNWVLSTMLTRGLRSGVDASKRDGTCFVEPVAYGQDAAVGGVWKEVGALPAAAAGHDALLVVNQHVVAILWSSHELGRSLVKQSVVSSVLQPPKRATTCSWS